MSETVFILQNFTNAVVGSSTAVHLLEQKSRLEQAVSSNDPALVLDTAKTLLESIFKTILSDRLESPDLTADFHPLYKKVGDVLDLNRDSKANKILKTLTSSIVHNIGELRNKYGAASHGKDGYFENPIEMPEAEMVAHIVDGMGGFLLKKHKHLADPEFLQRIYYLDYEEFNDWLDTSNVPITLPLDGAKDIPYSYFLFTHYVDSYRAMLLQYLDTEASENSSPTISIQINQGIETPALETGVEVIPLASDFQEIPAIKKIADAILLNEDIKLSFSEHKSREYALFVKDFAVNRAGTDWQNRENLVAGFRLALKKRLRRDGYPTEFLDQGIEISIEKAKEFFPSVPS